MKKLFLLLIIFACTTVYAQDEIWTVKKTVSEVFIEDGDTIIEEYVDEFSLALEHDSVLPLSFFLGMPEGWMTPENFEGARKKEETGKFAGLIQLPASMSYKELYDRYRMQLGTRAELAAALQNVDFVEFIAKTEGKSDIIAITLSYPVNKVQTNRTIVPVPRSSASHYKNDKKEVYHIPHNGEGGFLTTPCPQCHQTLVLERLHLGIEEWYEIFILEKNSVQYDGWHPQESIIPKGAWIFVTQYEDPYYWD